MRLLNATTLEFKEFYDPPRYTLLSHRCGDEEVSYEDFVLSRQPDHTIPEWQRPYVRQVRRRSGYEKILSFCSIVRTSGVFVIGAADEWCWLDTCCIDKRSSAELSEAINSMWRWYRNAARCLVYLADVDTLDPSSDVSRAKFRLSEWFSRCWTLQELLAPCALLFFNKDWTSVLTLAKAAKVASFKAMNAPSYDGLVDDIAKATDIPAGTVSTVDGYKSASAAQKMSWAAHRGASRVEDIAYSLLGLFDINMPLLYGEGENAFTRLQLEILSKYDDESILAWRASCRGQALYGHLSCWRDSILAASPLDFASCGRMLRCKGRNVQVPYAITNRGLHIQVKCEIAALDESGASQGSATTKLVIPLHCEESLPTGLSRCYVILVSHEGQVCSDAEHAQSIEGRRYCCKLDKPLFKDMRLSDEILDIFVPLYG